MVDLQKDISKRVHNIGQDINLAKLRPVEGAVYNSYDNKQVSRCCPGTRVDLLRQIDEWVNEPCSKCIYWLQGMAGTGKSTISRTVAEELDIKDVLGASFFFKRGEGDRGKAARLFTTVASQLVRRLPSLVPHVRNAIETDPAIADKTTQQQFDKLILEPLAKCKDDPQLPALVLVVIDALDECDPKDGATAIIRLLAGAGEVKSARLRFFVTSRPELPIRIGFGGIGAFYRHLALHEIPKSDIERDITLFLKVRLEQIRKQYSGILPDDWPCRKQVQKLVHLAVPLFIFAATACRFIEDKRRRGDPNERLEKFAQNQTGGSGHNATYRPILDQMIGPVESGEEDLIDELIKDFKEVVGSIITLADPLSVASLERLLGRSMGDIDRLLGFLHSVLDIHHDRAAPVRPFHQSFRDYLIDPRGGVNEFFVNEKDTHEILAIRCLDLLMEVNTLKKDICNLHMPGTLREDVDRRKIDGYLPSEVQYACLYWVHHLKGSRARLHDGHRLLQFLQRHILHWLEALSLMGRISESIRLIEELQGLVDVSHF